VTVSRELSVALALAALGAVLAARAPDFFAAAQVRAVLLEAAPVLVVAVGMTLVVLTRQIDVSVGAQFSVCGMVAGLLAKEGVPLPLVFAAAVLAGAALGAVNGALVAFVRLPAIVVTLATLVVYREALRWWREGEFVRDVPPGFQWFGLGGETGPWAVIGAAVAVFVLFAWGLRYLAAGRAVYATGSDAEAARLAGIRPDRVVCGVFVLMGGLTGGAAVLNAVRFADVDPTAGAGLELRVIAAVVVGGVAITGGRGRPFGTLLGVALLAAVGPALVFLKAKPEWGKAIQGGIILVAVASDALARRRA
jgi:rhamnose transport system permease protein